MSKVNISLDRDEVVKWLAVYTLFAVYVHEHDDGDEHDPENYRGCMHVVCEKSRAFLRELKKDTGIKQVEIDQVIDSLGDEHV